MSEKKGKPHALRLRKLAEAWALEAQQELQLEAEDIELTTDAFRKALKEQIARVNEVEEPKESFP
jgi:hypothetical protein